MQECVGIQTVALLAALWISYGHPARNKLTDFITSFISKVYIQEEHVAAAVESNLQRQSQTVSIAFCQLALFDAFGLCADNQENYLGALEGSFIPHKDYLSLWSNHSHSEFVAYQPYPHTS